MPVDSDSAIAWHRAQLKKLRETLRNIEGTRFTVGELAQSTRTGKTQKAIAELQQKIRQSQHIIAAYERLTPARGKWGRGDRRRLPGEWHRSRSHQFLAASFAFALQEIKKVKARALRAISAVFSSVLASEI